MFPGWLVAGCPLKSEQAPRSLHCKNLLSSILIVGVETWSVVYLLHRARASNRRGPTRPAPSPAGIGRERIIMENAGDINIQFLVVLLQVGYIRAHQFHSCPAFRTLPEPQCPVSAQRVILYLSPSKYTIIKTLV